MSPSLAAPIAPRPSPGHDRASGSVPLDQFAIIYFGNDWSAENRTSSHHIAERLAERTRVLYVESPGLRAPKASGRDMKKLWRKMLSAVRRPRSVGHSLWLMSVPQIPFRRLPFVRRVNAALGRLLVRRALKRLGFARTVSWFAVPHPGDLAHAFDEAAVVYYCIDDYAALPGVDARAVTEMDARLTRRADQVFVASAPMLLAKSPVRPSTVLVPHGVDAALFRRASERTLPVAPGARHLRRPVIGFFGLIEAWIDLDLIADIAERRPRWTFLLIGRLAVDPGRLKALPNVVFAGTQPYRSLPNWAKAFDVAIIPYRLTRQVVNSAPLKLREYLATGRPIVAVPAPEIERFAGLVRIAQGPEHFIREIEDALASDRATDRDRRIAATATMTWEARVSEIVEIVERRIWEKEHHS
jgi:glycosyltransferase involved in cell wall biosynthesis